MRLERCTRTFSAGAVVAFQELDLEVPVNARCASLGHPAAVRRRCCAVWPGFCIPPEAVSCWMASP